MNTSAKVAYLKGLAEGMELDRETKEGKLITAIIDVLEEIALDIEDLEEYTQELADEVDDISDDLSELEDACCEDEDDEYEAPYPISSARGSCCGFHAEQDDDDGEEPVFYEVTCPSCGNTITVDEDVLLLEEVDCPNCGELLEFDIEEENDADGENEE